VTVPDKDGVRIELKAYEEKFKGELTG